MDVIITQYANMYSFLPRSEEIKTQSNIEKYDLAISIDCATIKRLDNAQYFENAKKNNSNRPSWK